MAILSSDKLVVVKAFAPGNPLPLDAREIYESLAAAQEYAASSAIAYAGQTIKVVEGNVVTAYILAPSTEEGVNYKLQFAGGGGGAIQAISASAKAGHITVTGVSGEEAVTTDVAVTGAYVGAEKVEETAEKSAATKFTYVNGAGVQQTKNIYESGVRKVELSGANTNKIVVTNADKDGALSTSEVLLGVGSVKNPTYDSETRKITLPVMNATGATEDLVINLGKDMVVKSGSYDNNTKQIVLVLTDNTEVRINATDLVDIYTGGNTSTVNVTVSGENVITAVVNVSAEEGNKLEVRADGLYVPSTDAEIQAVTDKVNAVEEAYKAADTAIGERIDGVAEDVAGNTTAIENETAAREAADSALQEQITENKNNINLLTNTTIPNVEKAYKAADEALGERIGAVEEDVTGLAETTIPAVEQAYKAADEALGERIGAVETDVKTIKDTTIPAVEQAYKAADGALGERIDGVAEDVASNTTAIENEATARETAINEEVENRNAAIKTAIDNEVIARNAAIAEAMKNAGVKWVDFGADA